MGGMAGQGIGPRLDLAGSSRPLPWVSGRFAVAASQCAMSCASGASGARARVDSAGKLRAEAPLAAGYAA